MNQRARLETALSDRYRLLQELGRGGTAIVWLAEDLRHRRRVALKTLHPELAATVGTGRFLREIEIAAGLTHPNILPLYESGDAAGILYYAMPVAEGESLRQRLVREIQLPLDEALRIAAEVADALAYAHARGVVHRDIKPENILMHNGHAVVADFGVAKALASATGESLTATGLAIGTLAYMSPEQASGSDHVDGRSDLYALGCVLFEMLAGEPPFSAPTPQALAAKHQQASPPKVRLTRKTVPEWVDAVIDRALAKVPADRYPTAHAFRQAIEQPPGATSDRAGGTRRWTKPAMVAGGAVLVAAALAALVARVPHALAVLDENKVVVFPLRALGNSTSQTEGEAVATYVGYALDGSEPLRWLDGWDYLSQRERQALDTFSVRRATEVSRQVSARYFIDGSVLHAGDSVAVVLRLHDVLGDSVVKRAGASQPAASADPPVLGLRAVSELLPALVDPGREVDLGYLLDRRPAAIAAFLRGERSYRRMWFEAALQAYTHALAADSQLAVAALRGAQAALLLERYDQARSLSQLVLDGKDALSVRYAPFAKGLQDFVDGRADSAVAAFKQATSRDKTSPEAWTALGETYYHLLPTGNYQDSLPYGALSRAEALDSTFTPALVHLAQFAIRRGDFGGAARLIDRIAMLEPEGSGALRRLDVSLRCARDGPTAVTWGRVVGDTEVALPVARILSIGAMQSQCAEAAYRALWSIRTSADPGRWGTLFGLAGVLAAQGRTAALSDLLTSEESAKVRGQFLLLLAFVAGAAGQGKADSVANEYLASGLKDAPTAWLVGEWQASRGDSPGLGATLRRLRNIRDTSSRRADSVMVAALEIRASLLRGDTSDALRRFSGVTPSAPPASLEWFPWEAFAPERAIVAEALAKRGQWDRAASVAEQFDSPASVVYVMFVRRALDVRLRAARALGRRELADSLRDRLRRLDPKRGSDGRSNRRGGYAERDQESG